jgi:hypothetical protein
VHDDPGASPGVAARETTQSSLVPRKIRWKSIFPASLSPFNARRLIGVAGPPSRIFTIRNG